MWIGIGIGIVIGWISLVVFALFGGLGWLYSLNETRQARKNTEGE